MQKAVAFIILLSFLFQSCYSYKVIDKNSTLAIEKKYKIKQGTKYEKVLLLSSTDSSITVKNHKNLQNTIPKKEIQTIKKRRFSVAKTALLLLGIAAVAVVTLVAFSGGDFIRINVGSLQSPP